MITYKDCPECGARKIHSTVRLCEVCETCEKYESKLDALRAEIEMLRGVGCREAKLDEPESGPCGVCLKCAEERGAEWADRERLRDSPGRLCLPEEIEYERAEEQARFILEARAEIERWLDQGEVELARQAFDLIPAHALSGDTRLRELAHQLEDAEEAQRHIKSLEGLLVDAVRERDEAYVEIQKLRAERRQLRHRVMECLKWVGVVPYPNTKGFSEMIAVRDLAIDTLEEIKE